MNIKTASLTLAAALAFCQSATAEEVSSSYLLDDLGEQTSIATRTRLKVDYAPGTINILHSDDLMTQGARTVWESLALVPGFEMSMDETGTRQILVRGMGKSYSSGAIKILVNDIALNSELMSLANPVLNMPMEQVERIEVIRGPGSAIYGESAYAGVVNVITRKQGQRLFAGAGSAGMLAGGGVMSYANEETGLDFNLNLAGWKTDGNGQAGPDQLYREGRGDQSHAPGPINDTMDYRSALFALNYHKSSLSALLLEDGTGDHYGINNILPPDEKRIVTRHRHRALEFRQKAEFTPALQAEFKLGWQDFSHTRDRLYLDPAPWYLSRDYREKRLTAGADLALEQGIHTMLLGWSYNHSEIVTGNWNWNGPVDLGEHFIDTSMSRTVNSFTAQDEIRLSERFTLTAGLRHDHYDDIGSSTTPRLAAVWQAAPGHTIKAQYAEAFRAPTFYEIYNGGEPANIQPETIATSELGYLYKGARGNAGITLFHSRLDHLIRFVDSTEYIGYQNGTGGYSRGVELEGEKWLSTDLKFSGNLTWLDTHDDNTNSEIAGAGHWLANAGLEYRVSQDLSFGLRLRQVGERSREVNDVRAPLGGYQVTDITARLFNVAGTKGLTLRAGIRNLFDQDVRYPAMSMQLGIYPDDYPRGSRQWWALMSYSF